MSASLRIVLLSIAVAVTGAIAAWWLLAGEPSSPSGESVALGTTGEPAHPPSFALDGGAAPPRAAEPIPVADLVGESEPAVHAAGSAAAAAAAPARSPVAITGRVIDAVGRPLEGARVLFIESPIGATLRWGGARGSRSSPDAEAPEAPETLTGRDGRFAIQAGLRDRTDTEDLPLAAAQPALVVAGEGFATAVHACAGLAPGAYDAGDIALEWGAWITGRAVDEVGRPLAGAQVRARSEPPRDGPRVVMSSLARSFPETLGTVTTGADGLFSIGGLAPGRATLTATADGRRSAVREGIELEARRGAEIGNVALELGASISGVVVDGTGAPVAGALVSVSSMARLVLNRLEDLPRQQLWEELGQRKTTGEDGAFEIAGLSGGNYNLHVRAEGFEPLDRENVPAGTRDLRMRVDPFGGLLVRLLAPIDGRPVSGATVVARPEVEGGSPFGPRADASAVLGGAAALAAAGRTGDPEGVYFVRSAGRDGTRLVVAAEGFATAELVARGVAPGIVAEESFTLVAESLIEGRVVDGEGSPVAGATVTASRPDEDEASFTGGARAARSERRFSRRFGDDDDDGPDPERLTVRSGLDGGFVLRGLAGGAWELRASAPEHAASQPLPVRLDPAGATRDVEIALVRAGWVAGVVREADGTPAADVEVSARSSAVAAGDTAGALPGGVRLPRWLRGRGDDRGVGRARTDAQGAYRIDGLEPGHYEVAVSSGPLRDASFGGAVMLAMGDGGEGDPGVPARVTAGEETRVDLVRAARGRVSGRVVAAGVPVGGVDVRLRRRGGMPFGGRQAVSDERGDYVFEDVEAGEWEVSALAPGAALEKRVPVELQAGRSQRADLVFGGSTLSGRVVVQGGEQGAPGVSLVVSPLREGGDAGEPRVQMSFQIVTRDSGGGGAGMTMDIGGGPASQVRTDAEGRFELRYLEPGRYAIEASGGGFLPASLPDVEVRDGEHRDDLKLEVVRGGAIAGEVRDGATGARLDKLPVRLESDGDTRMTVTADGRYRFEGLEAGDYEVTVLGSSFGGEALARKTLEIAAGEQATLDLTTKG